ncbi:LOW QUALITY PROTEIN: inositol 3-kinase [Argentina anserina]|uniref:LOW QUALITY PROTEIN: inositol 3-kinase n=1 Tax=Argentina anserina TaxID=57926 RepID=UPI0021768430|nr:LOW QUALITY PROTEIN: inositol 3-kinase [Potentilla anserina]
MGRNRAHPRRCLIAGNYCHDVLIRDGLVLAQTLGGAASFISNVLDGVAVTYNLVSKVGSDFAYSVHADPIVVPHSSTTLFHAHFESGNDGEGKNDRVLKRVTACDPIRASDLPEARFDFGMAVGVGGEITVETVEKLVEMCGTVFVDIQALIRVFDEADGAVRLVGLKESGFYHLLPRIGFIKASAEEALFMDVEEVRKVCCVVVTNGKRGSRVVWRDGEVEVGPFPTSQVDPTGAGDSFLGGFVAGLVNGLAVPDAALLGNLFGSLTVGQIGLPKFDLRMLQRVQEEVQKRKVQCLSSHERKDEKFRFMNVAGHEQFHASLIAAKQIPRCIPRECEWNLPSSPSRTVEQTLNALPHFTAQPKLLPDFVYEEPITVDRKPLLVIE